MDSLRDKLTSIDKKYLVRGALAISLLASAGYFLFKNKKTPGPKKDKNTEKIPKIENDEVKEP